MNTMPDAASLWLDQAAAAARDAAAALAGAPADVRNAALRAAAAALRAAHGSAPHAGDAAITGERGEATLVFTRGEAVWAAQGDPLGPRRDAVSAIWRFRDLCERNGVRPAFLDVGEAHARVYADIGLQVVQQGGRRVAAHEGDLQTLL